MQGSGFLKAQGLLFEGDTRLLDRPRRALLISRTERRPVPATPWVRRTVLAARQSAQAGEVLVCGAERTAHRVALAACGKAGGAALVILERAPDAAWRLAHEALLPARRLLVWPSEGPPKEDKSAVPWRDTVLAELAGCAWTMAIRKGGNMQAVAERLRAKGCAIEDAPPSDAPAPKRAADSHFPAAAPHKGAVWPFLTHFTREPDGAWPGEGPAAYAEWLAHGPLDATREAFDALKRILETRRILGGGRLMPERMPMISFTARAPWDLGEIVQWRRGLRRWTIRPYGLAVRREALEALGARPVRYLAPAELKALPPEARLYAQKHDPPRTDWSREAEWRLRGDLDLNLLPREAIRLLVPNSAEAQCLRQQYGLKVQPMNE